MNKLSVFDWIVLALFTIGAVAYVAGSQNVFKEYTKDGMTFQYPSDYKLTENSYKNPLGSYDEAGLANPLSSDAAPMRIIIGIYRNPGKLSVDQWIKKHANDLSHFNDQKGDFIPVKISGAIGAAYPWSNFVNAEQVVLARGADIVYLTVIYKNSNDSVVGDFQRLLSSLKLN
jgi:hypothetical protein